MSIHQEAVVDATPAQVYAVLTDGVKFAAATGMPARVRDREGEQFALFGGRVEGRQIELVPGERVVQAWRFGGEHPDTWDAGVYSVVRFTLKPEGKATKLVIDHHGIPSEWQDHIASGYPTFYADPIARHFAARATSARM
ncbi:MAG: SRPBCC domain-containing protein [Solirubrobacteraceae bacterium]